MNHSNPDSPSSKAMDSDLLFVYGTLGPATPDEVLRRGFAPDAVRGRLFDLRVYPALVDLDDPTAPWIPGHVRPVSEFELATVLDPYEGVDEGLFRRSRARTQRDRWVWVYVYARLVPQWARRLLARWEGQRIDPTREPRPTLLED
jgi:gamma-glutamylcyclotransferase (GGCT)/AIG2-like uncharacterized protein YtfP